VSVEPNIGKFNDRVSVYSLWPCEPRRIYTQVPSGVRRDNPQVIGFALDVKMHWSYAGTIDSQVNSH
jgi:hypothetical protein